jgi:Photosynthetic reaction centre cytochrome C subunit
MRNVIVAVALVVVAFPAATQTPQQKRNPHVLQILEQIKGQEDKPAGEVFKNVQQMKDIPAKRLLAIMEVGYARSLGVTCEHCHVEGRWEADEKRPKLAARDMATMVKEINDRLAKMQNLEVQGQGRVNCTTCHRGSVKPALDLK